MGAMQHKAVIATTYSNKEVEAATKFIDTVADEFKALFVMQKGVVNNETTVCYVPDGSKEGWSHSDKSDYVRSDFVSFLLSREFEDGSSPWYFIEVSYGQRGQALIGGNCG